MTGRRRRQERVKPFRLRVYGWCNECGKRAHDTRKEAKRAASRTRSAKGGPLDDYACPHGNGFHVGHLPPAVKRGEKSRAELADEALELAQMRRGLENR